VTLIGLNRLQYRVVIIDTPQPFTVQQFCQTFVRPSKRRLFASNNDPLTQDWLLQNMATVAEHFIDYNEEEDEYKASVVRYSTVFAIAEINTLQK
jgi:hypothetical protein